MSSHRELDLFAPTPEHALLADTLETFVAREVEPQAAEHDRDENLQPRAVPARGRARACSA